MKHFLLLALLLVSSLHSFAQCESIYFKAGQARVKRNAMIALGASFVVPVTGSVLLSAAAGTSFLVYGFGLRNPEQTTFGKVLRVLEGETHLLRSKVLKHLGLSEAPAGFDAELAAIVDLLNSSKRACPSLGFDSKFRDHTQVFNFKEFTGLVSAEYDSRQGH